MYNPPMEQPLRQKKHIITIAGRPGSGKSTTAKLIAAQLGFDHASGGDLYRAAAMERGMDILQANFANAETGEIDKIVDDKMREINASGDRVVIDSRTAWHFIPNSFKVFLDLDLLTAAERILSNMDEARREREHIPADPHEYAEQLRLRQEAEIRRYIKLYNIEPFNLENYNIVIDTKNTDPQRIANEIIKQFEVWIASEAAVISAHS